MWIYNSQRPQRRSTSLWTWAETVYTGWICAIKHINATLATFTADVLTCKNAESPRTMLWSLRSQSWLVWGTAVVFLYHCHPWHQWQTRDASCDCFTIEANSMFIWLDAFNVKKAEIKWSNLTQLIQQQWVRRLLCLNSGAASFPRPHLKANYVPTPSLFPLFGGCTTTILCGLTYPKILWVPKKKKEREKMVTLRGVDCHFRGPGQQKLWRKCKHLVMQPGNAPQARLSHLTMAVVVNKISLKDPAFEDLKGRVLRRMQTLNWDIAIVTLQDIVFWNLNENCRLHH